MAKTIFCASGGGSRGAFQGGVLEALVRRGIMLDGFAGVSTGSIQCGFMAQAQKGSSQAQRKLVVDLKRLWEGLERLDVYDKLGTGEAADIVRGRRSHLYDLKLANILKAAIKSGPQRPLRIGVVDLESGEFVELDPTSPQELYNAIVASCSVPVVFRPQGSYVDGGVRQNAPVAAGFDLARTMKVAQSEDLRLVVALTAPRHTTAVEGDWGNKIYDVATRSLELMQKDNTETDIRHALDINDLIPYFKDRPISEWPSILLAEGKPKLHVEPLIIEPQEAYLYDFLRFEKEEIKALWAHGVEQANHELDRAGW